MSRGASPDPASFDCVIEIAAPPETVYSAFFSREALQRWWGVIASITGPRPLGIYALEWARSPEADPLLGPWGGAFYGVVIDVRLGREFFLADAYWMPPEGDPIGPMAVHVTCEPDPRRDAAAIPAERLRRQPALAPLLPRHRRLVERRARPPQGRDGARAAAGFRVAAGLRRYRGRRAQGSDRSCHRRSVSEP